MLLDTSIWIELFEGTSKVPAITDAIGKTQLYTSVLSISETKLWSLKKQKDLSAQLAYMRKNSIVLGIDNSIAELAAELRFSIGNSRVGLVDCLIYASAEINGIPVLSLDSDFRAFRNAIIL